MPDFPLEIACSTVKQMLDAGASFQLIDCREKHEHEIAAIDDAKLIPMSEFPAHLDQLEPYRNSPIVVLCHHGGRSAQVTTWLRGQGFARTQSMAGGIDQWAKEIDPQIPRY